MSIFEIGRLCVKIAGRDAGNTCVVVENVDESFVIVDGNVRRKRVNIKHLEPIAQTIALQERASSSDVKEAFDKLGLPVWSHKSKKTGERPKQQRTVKNEQGSTGKALKKKNIVTKQKADSKSAAMSTAKTEVKAEVKTEKKVSADVRSESKPKAAKVSSKKE